VREQVTRGEPDRPEGRQVRRQRGIGDAVGMELLVDPLVEADRPNPLDVAGPGAVTEPVEGMNDDDERIVLGGGTRRGRRREWRPRG